jgi:DNA-binding MarR family transcriptional regulator
MRTTSGQRERATTIRRAATALASRARAERAGELSLNQTAVLGRVAVQGPITPGEVADQLRMLPQSLTRTFAVLEANGLVRRMPDPGDGRQSLLVATTEGRAALRAEMAPRDRWLARAMTAVLSDEECQELVRAAELMLRVADFESGVALVEL